MMGPIGSRNDLFVASKQKAKGELYRGRTWVVPLDWRSLAGVSIGLAKPAAMSAIRWIPLKTHWLKR